MPANKEGNELRMSKVGERKLAGKTFEQIGEEMGTSTATAWRDWQRLKQDENLQEVLEELKAKSLLNAVSGMEVEDKYLAQTQCKETITSQEAQVASSIARENQKRYSLLAGDNVNKKGGERRFEFEIVQRDE